MRKSWVIAMGIVVFTLTLHANESVEQMEDFQSLLSEVSEIATKKSLNVDYLPSVVTVVDAQTFVDGGIQNLGEALGMLPGIQVQINQMGYTMTTVRGFKNPNAYLSDKIKILIDGVAINNAVSGTTSFYMDFPMQLIEKIEVLRGPASTVYGAGAFYATVNVITKLGNAKKENQVFVGAGSYGYRTVGGNLFANAGDWNIFSDGYYQTNTKELYFEPQDGDTDEGMRDLSLGFKAQNGGLEFLARFKRSVYGNFYSFEGELDPIPQKGEEHINTYFFTQLAYKHSYNDYEFETKANFSHRELDTSANIYSIGSQIGKFSSVGIDMQDGFFYYEKSAEQNYAIESSVRLPEIASNDISLGVGLQYAAVRKDEFFSSVEDAIVSSADPLALRDDPSFRYRLNKEPAFWTSYENGEVGHLLDGGNSVTRTNVYAYAQDLISVSDAVDVILGLRLDNYSDFGSQLSKRAGIVYRANDELIFKVLYGSAFRAPTFMEAYQNGHINFRAGDENIKPEETNTYEAVVIYSPNFYNRFSLNVFYSELTNVIDLEEFQDTNPGYQNFDRRLSRGVEFEYNYKTKLAHNFYFNATYIDAGYTIPAEDGQPAVNVSMPDISDVMLKAMYIYTPIKALSFGTTWRYFAQTTSTELEWVLEEADEYDATAKAVHIFDETVTYRLSPSSEIRATVKNLFDADVRMPAYYYYTADGGIQREGRNYFVSYVHRF
jgi:outer membrane receptor for ferrienterochelin and colicins